MDWPSIREYVHRFVRAYVGWVFAVTALPGTVGVLLWDLRGLPPSPIPGTQLLLTVLVLGGITIAGYRVFAEEVDQRRAEHARLKSEIAELGEKLASAEERVAQPRVGWLKGRNLVESTVVQVKPASANPDFDQLVNVERGRLLAVLPPPPPEPDVATDRAAGRIGGVTIYAEHSAWEQHIVDRNTYREELEDYLNTFRSIKKFNHMQLDSANRVREVSFGIRNVGSVPLEDVEIHLHFPEGVTLMTEDDMERYSDPTPISLPIPPRPPVYRRYDPEAMLGASLAVERFSAPDWLFWAPPPLPEIDVGDPRGPTFNSSQAGSTAKYRIRSINPGWAEETLAPLHLWFGGGLDGQIIEVTAEVFAKALPAPHQAALTIQIEAVGKR